MKALSQSKEHSPEKNAGVYAVHHDFCKIFSEDMSGLHLLALLLTADGALAEQCFVAGFEDSMQSNRVFKQWAHSWSRRTIIKRAIQMVHPAPLESGSVADAVPPQPELEKTVSASLAVILRMPAFERFVLVMSTLEGYSNQDCATLLNCARQDVVTARTAALQQLAQASAIGSADRQVMESSQEKSKTWMPRMLVANPQHL